MPSRATYHSGVARKGRCTILTCQRENAAAYPDPLSSVLVQPTRNQRHVSWHVADLKHHHHCIPSVRRLIVIATHPSGKLLTAQISQPTLCAALVYVLQAANTLLFVWKLAISSGIVWERRFFIIPVPRYDAQLHSTATEGRTQDLDKVAMRYMFMLLTPVLIGFAFYNLAFQGLQSLFCRAHAVFENFCTDVAEFSSWYEYGLTTAVSAVYTFGYGVFVCPAAQYGHFCNLRAVTLPPQLCADDPSTLHQLEAPQRCTHALERPLLPLLQHCH